VLTIKSALLSLQSLLSTPEPKDPQDAEVASMLTKNPKEFARMAQEWAVKYAGAPNTDKGESSSSAAKDASKQRERKSREVEERERMLA
jgi:ubiquitin-conjugating enzyme (huntingtin interacting protein 2)